MITIQDLTEKISAFNSVRNWDRFHSPKNLAMSIMIEAAELAKCFQWLTQQESRSEIDDIIQVEDEVADVLIYLLNLCDKLKIDPINATLNKLEKNRKRFPV